MVKKSGTFVNSRDKIGDIAANSEGVFTNEPGFSTITPIAAVGSERRRIAAKNNYMPT